MDKKMIIKLLLNNIYGNTGNYGPKLEYVDTDSMGIKDKENV